MRAGLSCRSSQTGIKGFSVGSLEVGVLCLCSVRAAVCNSLVVSRVFFAWFFCCRCVYGTHESTVYLTSTGCVSRLPIHGCACARGARPGGQLAGAEHGHDGGRAGAQRLHGQHADCCDAARAGRGRAPRDGRAHGHSPGEIWPAASSAEPVEPPPGRHLPHPPPLQGQTRSVCSTGLFVFNS